MTDNKRKADDSLALTVKKQRTDDDKQIISSGPARTSSLEAPTMLLSGHKGACYTVKFNPSGSALASGSFDKEIFLWNTYGECQNFSVLKGHKNAVLELHWSSDGRSIYSVAADKFCAFWDVEYAERRKKCTGHKGVINSCHPARRGPELVVTGSDDRVAKIWDARAKRTQHEFRCGFPVTAVSFNDAADQVFTATVGNNDIACWDIRNNEVLYKLEQHQDIITGVSLSPDGAFLLSNSMDNTVRMWDIRPFASSDRCYKVFEGNHHNMEKNLLKCNWSKDQKRISAGSADHMVNVWDVSTGETLYRLAGHRGSVNEVSFHPEEPIIVSCSTDKLIYLGEIEP